MQFDFPLDAIGCHWMPLARRSFSCSVLATGMRVGAILSSLLTAALPAVIGWRWVFHGIRNSRFPVGGLVFCEISQ